MEARKSGDPLAIARASQRVIALGLVELARLRLDQKAYDEAIQLCQDSLDFEDTPQTHVDLAIANFYAKRSSEAVRQATLAADRDPQNALAWNVKGEALLQNKDYAGAAAALGRALDLKRDAESIYAIGIAYLELGNKQKAAGAFKELLTLTGDHGWSRVLVGRAYQEAKLPQEAEREFQTALQLDPGTLNAHYFWALTLLQANEWNPTLDVQSHLQEELKLSPRHFQANYLLGFFASNERNYDESDRYLRVAAQSNRSVPEIWLYFGLNAQGRGASRAAEAYFRKGIALTKYGDPREHLSMRKAYIGLGRILLSSERKKEGEEFLKKARELQLEDLAEQQKKIAAMNAKGGAGVGGAVVPYLPETDNRNSFSAAPAQGPAGDDNARLAGHRVTKLPQDPAGKTKRHLHAVLGSSFNDLATAEALQQQYDLAVKHYREAERWDPRIPGLQRNLGLAMFFVGQYGEAIRLLAREVRATPGDAHARAVLGLAYFGTEQFAKAERTISPIADRALGDPQLGFAWAKSLAETGDRSGAARALESLEQAELNFGAENLIQFGQLWSELGETQRAAQSFEGALRADPSNADAKCALGIALMRLSRLREAADLFLSVLADHPEHAEARYQIGRALLEMGNLPEAIRHLEEAARLEPARLSVHLELERAYRKAGRMAEADREHVLCASLEERRPTKKDPGPAVPPK